MRRRLTVFAPLLALALAGAGCDDTDSGIDLSATGTVPTSVYVDPSLFLGDVPCSAATGAMQSYVATVVDVTDASAPFALPSSPPLTCTATVVFRQILAGHVYRVQIDGYHVPASSLTTLGGASSGSRSMVLRDAPDAGAVAPRWSTWCSDITAEDDVRSVPERCEPLAALTSETGVAVDPRGTLAGTGPSPGLELACKATSVDPDGNPVDVGDVASFDLHPADPALPPLLNLPCAGPAPAAYTQGITPGAAYTFRVEARAEAGGPVRWGATCSAVAVKGLIATAVCDALSEDGALDLSLADLLEASGKTCVQAGVVTYDAELGAPADLVAQGVACEKPVRFAPIAPGTYAATLVGRGADGSTSVSATCTAEIAPGAVSTGACTLSP